MRQRVSLFRRLSAAGVRRGSLLLFPLRKRLPPRRQQLDLISGASLQAPPDEELLPMFDEIWVSRYYLPGDWAPAEAPTVLDIGANIGVFTVWAATELGAEHIVAVEPDPRPAEQLRANIELNHLRDVAILDAAVGGARRAATLYARGPTAMNTLFSRDVYESRFGVAANVHVLTLDDVFEQFGIQRCDLLKLDCEGAEYEILYGASPDSLAKVDHLVAECHVGLNDHDPDALEAFLEQRGFAVKRFPPLDEEGEHLHASRSRDRLHRPVN
jgi:FkbM family methyltransferase